MTHTSPSFATNCTILRYLYEHTTVWNAVNAYCSDLIKSGKVADFQHAQKLLEYKRMATNHEFIKGFNIMSTDIIEFISESLPDILFRYVSRQKSLTRVDDKIISLQLENSELPNKQENPIDRIHDFFAARIIITNNDPVKATAQAYQVANRVAEFFESSEDFEILEAAPVKDTGNFDPKKFPKIYVPKKSGLKVKYRKAFKDYILFIKENGYQSLHITIRDKKTGFTFEIQIRTQQQHVHAELNEMASHFIFRDKQNQILFKYGLLEEIDFSRILINGFLATGNPEIPYDDETGILDSIVLYQRPKNW